MNGLSLSRLYFRDIVFPAFREAFPDTVERMAFGLAGPGSECFGFDDELSRDHDWGPRLCIWLQDELYEKEGAAMAALYDSLPRSCRGYGPVKRLDTARQRDGVFSISSFFATHLGQSSPPSGIEEWIRIREEALSLSTNGELFFDDPGEMTAFRKALNGYYPRDLWLKKIASRCFMLGQYGQYNYRRAVRRNDESLAFYIRASFLREAAALMYLLNRSYRPFYKWLFYGLRKLGDSGSALSRLLSSHWKAEHPDEIETSIETIQQFLAGEIISAGLYAERLSYLEDYGFLFTRNIANPVLRDEIEIID